MADHAKPTPNKTKGEIRLKTARVVQPVQEVRTYVIGRLNICEPAHDSEIDSK